MYTHKLNHIQVAVDIFVANNHGNQKYSESYRNDFDTWLKVLTGIAHAYFDVGSETTAAYIQAQWRYRLWD